MFYKLLLRCDTTISNLMNFKPFDISFNLIKLGESPIDKILSTEVVFELDDNSNDEEIEYLYDDVDKDLGFCFCAFTNTIQQSLIYFIEELNLKEHKLNGLGLGSYIIKQIENFHNNFINNLYDATIINGMIMLMSPLKNKPVIKQGENGYDGTAYKFYEKNNFKYFLKDFIVGSDEYLDFFYNTEIYSEEEYEEELKANNFKSYKDLLGNFIAITFDDRFFSYPKNFMYKIIDGG
jgi:hypothetical protein